MSATALPAAPAPAGTTTPPPANTGVRPWRITRDEYYRLGELGFFDGRRVQLIRGEIVEMGKQGWPHALAIGLIADILRVVFASGQWVSEQPHFRTAGSEPEADVGVFPGAKRDYADHPDVATLLVEVADTSLFYDTTTKAELYATAGVPEYWVLDLNGRVLHVFRDPHPLRLPPELGATAYRTHDTFGPSDSVSPLAVPAATVRVADLLP